MFCRLAPSAHAIGALQKKCKRHPHRAATTSNVGSGSPSHNYRYPIWQSTTWTQEKTTVLRRKQVFHGSSRGQFCLFGILDDAFLTLFLRSFEWGHSPKTPGQTLRLSTYFRQVWRLSPSPSPVPSGLIYKGSRCGATSHYCEPARMEQQGFVHHKSRTLHAKQQGLSLHSPQASQHVC